MLTSVVAVDAAFNLKGDTTEASVTEHFTDKSVRELEELGEGEVEAMAVLRGRQRTSSPSGILKLRNGDIVILQGEPTALARVVSAAKLKLLRTRPARK